MKSKNLLVLLLLLITLSLSSARRIRYHKGDTDQIYEFHPGRLIDHKLVNEIKQTVAYKFIWGFMLELSGKGDIIESCYTEIKAIMHSDNGKPCAEAGTKKPSESLTVMEKVIKYLGIAIDVLCTVKHFILSALTRRFRRFKRFRRLFIHGRSTRRFRLKVEFDKVLNSKGFFESIEKGLKGLGEDISKGVTGIRHEIGDKIDYIENGVKNTIEELGHTKLGSFIKDTGEKIAEGVTLVGDKLKEGFEWFKNKVSEAFHKVVEYLDQIKNKIEEWVTGNKNIKLLISVSKCLMKVGEAYWKVKVTLEKIATLGVSLFNPIAYVTLVLNFMCGWKLVRKAVDYFSKMTSEEDRLLQADYFGRFIANIAAAFAGLTS